MGEGGVILLAQWATACMGSQLLLKLDITAATHCYFVDEPISLTMLDSVGAELVEGIKNTTKIQD